MSIRHASHLMAIVAVSAALASALRAAPQGERAGGTIAFPEGYRSWTHVKSTIVGPEAQSFATNGGLHHFYANGRAVEGYRSGVFPDGAILIDDLLEVKSTAPGTSGEGARRRVAVMVKDGRRFADTGGWGFEVFRGDARDGSLSPDGRAACHGCHKKADAGVFSSLPGATAAGR